MERHEVINYLSGGQFESYLEIGVEAGVTFNQVDIGRKVAVDPQLKISIEKLDGTAFPVYSDYYFEKHQDFFDCIFIDGLHHYEQSTRDFVHAWSRLNKGGVVLIDDCYPSDEIAAMRDHTTAHHIKEAQGASDRNWMGDVYKTVVWINDCTDYAYAFIEGTMGVVAVWQEKSVPRKKWMPDENHISNCDYKTFCSFPLPKMTVDQIHKRLHKTRKSQVLFGLLSLFEG